MWLQSSATELKKDSIFPLQLQETSERERINKKYPSFELVLKFVRTDSLSRDQVNSLLDQRSDIARMVAQSYSFCAEVIRTLGVENLFEVCGSSPRHPPGPLLQT